MISASFVDPTSQTKIANSALYGQFVKVSIGRAFSLPLHCSGYYCQQFSTLAAIVLDVRKPSFHVLQIVEVFRLQ